MKAHSNTEDCHPFLAAFWVLFIRYYERAIKEKLVLPLWRILWWEEKKYRDGGSLWTSYPSNIKNRMKYGKEWTGYQASTWKRASRSEVPDTSAFINDSQLFSLLIER